MNSTILYYKRNFLRFHAIIPKTNISQIKFCFPYTLLPYADDPMLHKFVLT